MSRRTRRRIAVALYAAGFVAGLYLVALTGPVAQALAHHRADAPRAPLAMARYAPDLLARERVRAHPSWRHLRLMVWSRWRATHPAAERRHNRLEAERRRRVTIAAWAHANRAVSECESGGSLTAYNPAGPYHGKWQFDLPTWWANGGRSHPSGAPEAEQDAVAYATVRARGWSPWPVCGRRAVSVP